jgi:hypothetical protein
MASDRHQPTFTDGRFQVRRDAALAVGIVTCLRDEEDDASPADREL